MQTPVSLGPSGWPGVFAERVDSVSDALAVAREWAQTLPLPGSGGTARLWEHLATMAAHDLGAARAIEPHLDAIAILTQAGATPPFRPDATWGVFAAEGGEPLLATARGGEWMLDGTKLWCSLADRLDAALVSATMENGERALFAVDLHSRGVTPRNDGWVARGLSEIPSGPIDFDRVPALPIGAPGWYLSRAGFSWGGIGVAACWYGGAVGLGRTLFAAAAERADPLINAGLGAVDVALNSARRALAEAATLVDAGLAEGEFGRLTAKRVRSTVAGAAEDILLRTGHALGPAPLAQDPAHAKRVADLQLYLRQHHAERDDASLGSAIAIGGAAPW